MWERARARDGGEEMMLTCGGDCCGRILWTRDTIRARRDRFRTRRALYEKTSQTYFFLPFDFFFLRGGDLDSCRPFTPEI